MARNKKVRYAEIAENDLVVQSGKPIFEEVKGCWNEKVFQNNKPIVVELACGKGEYTTGLATQYPDKNFVGVDIKGGRLWMGCKEVARQSLNNVAFLRADIRKINSFFDRGEVDEIWLTFPDPQPKKEKARLTNPWFLALYEEILKESGSINLKTDNSDLFDYTLGQLVHLELKTIHATKDLYRSPLYRDELTIKTTFEEKFGSKGFKINYLKFSIE